jgi:penicillin G amidase
MGNDMRVGVWVRRGALGAGLAVVVVAGGVLGWGTWVMRASRPVLEGSIALPGLTGGVTVERDAAGVPTLTASNRLDLARALGFVHAQERFFGMDLLRRAGAGELAALAGARALSVDRAHRLHRFRWRAEQALAKMPETSRALLRAYTEGVNTGLAALGHAPWEYSVLRVAPTPWTAADTLLVTYAMYFDLEDSDATNQLAALAERAQLGSVMAEFLYPKGSPDDAPLDGSRLPEPPMPANRAPLPGALHAGAEPPTPGSNNFAVAGRLSTTGAAIVENDMHLALRVPNIWFRARLKMPGGLDIIGVTLPGVPFVVVGSNTHIAWAFTDSYIETGDAVIVEQLQNDPQSYKTPDGPRQFTVTPEKICAAHAGCETISVRETIWGPVVGEDDAGHPVVWRWVADDENAVSIEGFADLERDTTVRAALETAHKAGIPDQNFVVGDSDGHIGWTVIGQIPRRVGMNDQLPHSWADGSVGWRGYLSASEIPEIVDPPEGRLWSANARTLGGPALALLGDGGYAGPARARAIHDDLFAKDKFAETDLLAIANETRAAALDPWQKIMLTAIDANAREPRIAVLRGAVTDWGGHAAPDSAGYRLVREFRAGAIDRIYAGLAAKLGSEAPVPRQGNHPSIRLLTERPAALVPPPYKNWDELTGAVLHDLADQVDLQAGGQSLQYTWGARNHTGIHHPIAAAIPGLPWLTDPRDEPVAGDNLVPRVAIPGFGASERLIVSPGHEAQGIFEMPTGQAGDPLSPYYGAGHKAWVKGEPTPLLPGPTRWQLQLIPRA